MNSVCVMYNKKEKRQKKRNTLEHIFKGKNFVLRGFDLDLKDK